MPGPRRATLVGCRRCRPAVRQGGRVYMVFMHCFFFTHSRHSSVHNADAPITPRSWLKPGAGAACARVAGRVVQWPCKVCHYLHTRRCGARSSTCHVRRGANLTFYTFSSQSGSARSHRVGIKCVCPQRLGWIVLSYSCYSNRLPRCALRLAVSLV